MMENSIEEQGSLILAAEDCPEELFEKMHRFSNYEERIILSLMAHGLVLIRGGRGARFALNLCNLLEIVATRARFTMKPAFWWEEEKMSRKLSNLSIALVCSIVLLSGCGEFLKYEYMRMKAEVQMCWENYENAIPFYKDYLAQNPEMIEARNKLGFAYLKTGRLSEAISEFNAVLSAEPQDPYAILYIGLSYLNKEEFGRTINIWQGYKDKKRPLVEAEISRQMTLLLVVESQRAAKKAMAEEMQRETVKPAADTIAVCYYQDLSPDKSLRAFQKGLAAMITTDLSKIKSLKVVERVRVQALLEELALGRSEAVDKATAPRIGRLLGAGNILIGNLSPGSIAAVTTLMGKARSTSSVVVPEKEFYNLPIKIVGAVAKALEIEITPEEKAEIGVPHTTVHDALVYYGEALDAMDAGHWEKAKDLFGLAIKADPQFSLAQEGDKACPSHDSPSIRELKAMPAAKVKKIVEIAVEKAVQTQNTRSMSKYSKGDARGVSEACSVDGSVDVSASGPY